MPSPVPFISLNSPLTTPRGTPRSTPIPMTLEGSTHTTPISEGGHSRGSLIEDEYSNLLHSVNLTSGNEGGLLRDGTFKVWLEI